MGKELAFMMNNMELRDICDSYLQVEYKEGANRNNKIMLTKRFMESFDDSNIDDWIKRCNDRNVLTHMSNAMGLETSKKTPIQEIKDAVIHQVCIFGETVVLHRLNMEQLRAICEDMNIEGSENTSSKRILVEAIISRTDIPARAGKKKVKVTKKKPIAKASEYLELFQHYKASDLEKWCKENGL